MHSISLKLNGKVVHGSVEGRTLLVEFIREHQGLTGTHVGCDTSQCGACVVSVNGKAVKSCTILAASCGGYGGGGGRSRDTRRFQCRTFCGLLLPGPSGGAQAVSELADGARQQVGRGGA